ncbi:MAG TPA: Mur ligase domain-containing protein, partial [Fibrobacteria bacterium]|nr:Mur ligase domain-containing protein [Fibrobacteria bacterium]
MNLSHAFFSGIAGTGMSALAQYLAFQGHPVSGSDRSLDRGAEADKRAYFERLGIRLVPQDGKGLAGCSCLVVSTAIESQNPEVQAAGAQGIPVVHRSDLLAHLASLKKTVAVSGTSGKSTVSGMTYHVLAAGGLSPSLITGANLASLKAEGFLGNAKAGTGDWLVIEADESDGSLIKYRPEIGLVLNVEKDHKEISELIPLFRQFR